MLSFIRFLKIMLALLVLCSCSELVQAGGSSGDAAGGPFKKADIRYENRVVARVDCELISDAGKW